MQVKARINVIKESMKQVNAQSMYEEYTRSSQRKIYAEQNHDLEVSLQRIDDELVKCDIVLNKNKELEAFLNDAPKESKEFNRKVNNVLISVSKQNKTLEQQIADLEKNKKEVLDKKKQLDQQDFAWEIQYQDSKKNLQMNISGLQGIIGECKRLLDNNLV
jgi:predicted chitinase